MSARSYAALILKKPWYVSWRNAKRRCEDINHRSYANYGGRGVKFLLTREECQILWEHYGAEKMSRPELDRRDVDGPYSIENCRFLEKKDNNARRFVQEYPTEPVVWEE